MICLLYNQNPYLVELQKKHLNRKCPFLIHLSINATKGIIFTGPSWSLILVPWVFATMSEFQDAFYCLFLPSVLAKMEIISVTCINKHMNEKMSYAVVNGARWDWRQWSNMQFACGCSGEKKSLHSSFLYRRENYAMYYSWLSYWWVSDYVPKNVFTATGHSSLFCEDDVKYKQTIMYCFQKCDERTKLELEKYYFQNKIWHNELFWLSEVETNQHCK